MTDEETEKKIGIESIQFMRGTLFKAYEKTRYGLEIKMGFHVSFEDWLVVQLTMFATKGKPGPDQGFSL